MYRKYLLEFIANSFNELANIHIKRMCLIIFNKSTNNLSNKYQNLFNYHQTYLYNLKLPIIDKKIINLSDDEFYNYLLNLQEISYLYSNNINNNYQDLYYNQPLIEQDFKTLIWIPIYNHNGGLLIYSNELINDFKIASSSLTKLYNNLLNDEIEDLEAIIPNYISCDYYIKANNQIFYQDKIIHNNGRIIPNHYLQKSYQLNNQEFIFYYFDNTIQVMDYHLINNYLDKNMKDYVLIFFESNKLTNIKKVILENFSDNYYLFNQNNYYLLLILNKYSKVEFNHLFKDFSYTLFISSYNSVNNVNYKMDLIKLFDYVFKVKPNEFIKSEYTNYVYQFEQVNYDLTKEPLYKAFSNNIQNIYKINNYSETDKFEEQINTELEIINKNIDKYKNKYHDLILFIDVNNLHNSKLINLSKTNNVYVVLHKNQKQVIDDLIIKNILNLFVKGIKIIIDSSFYLSFNDCEFNQYISGIYLSSSQANKLNLYPNTLINQIIDYYLNKQQLIFVDHPKQKDHKSDINIYYSTK